MACEPLPAPTYEYGIQLNDLELNLITENVGVYPDTSVLLDPNNPFRDGIQGDGETRFQALDAGPIPGFYAFATANAIIPFGENQFYAADNLKTIYQRQLAPSGRPRPGPRPCDPGLPGRARRVLGHGVHLRWVRAVPVRPAGSLC